MISSPAVFVTQSSSVPVKAEAESKEERSCGCAESHSELPSQPDDEEELCLSSRHLELIVADVRHWQAQISSILNYASSQKATDFDESVDVVKLRVATLQAENKNLIGKIDDLTREKHRAADAIEELQLQLKQSLNVSLDKDRKLKEVISNHQKEIKVLKTHINQLQRKDQSIKQLANRSITAVDPEEWVIRPYCELLASNETSGSSPICFSPINDVHTETTRDGFDEDSVGSSRDCESPDSVRLRSEMQKIQESIRRLESQLSSKLRSSSRNAMRSAPERPSTSKSVSCSRSPNSLNKKDSVKVSKPIGNRSKSALACGTMSGRVTCSPRQLPSLLPKTPTPSERATKSCLSRGLEKSQSLIPSLSRRREWNFDLQTQEINNTIVSPFAEIETGTPMTVIRRSKMQPSWRP